jgi:hypothetical protein
MMYKFGNDPGPLLDLFQLLLGQLYIGSRITVLGLSLMRRHDGHLVSSQGPRDGFRRVQDCSWTSGKLGTGCCLAMSLLMIETFFIDAAGHLAGGSEGFDTLAEKVF